MDLLRAAGYGVPSHRWALCLFLWGARTYLPRKPVLEAPPVKSFLEVIYGSVVFRGVMYLDKGWPNPKRYNPRHARRK